MTKPKDPPGDPAEITTTPAVLKGHETDVVIETVAVVDPKLQAEKQTAEIDERSIVTAGQRRINMLWEVTQSLIALSSVGAGIFILVYQTLQGSGEVRDLPTTLSSMIFLIIGAYFSRTNHSATGGTGAKPKEPPYVGR